MGRKYELTRAAELKTLPIFREFIAQKCQAESIDEETCFAIQLSVDEASTNVVTHGYAGLNPGSITLSLRCDGDRVVVQITDFGHPFEPSEAQMPNVEAALDDRPLGGFGLFFIYQSMDEVNYETGEEGNILTLIKRLQS